VGVDCLDVEPGDANPSNAPAFVHGWTPVNTNKPVIYANGYNMSAIVSSLSKAGIARSAYYLWLADWDGAPSLPGGYDAKQYQSTSGFDADVFADYMFTAPPAAIWPLQLGSVGPMVTALQTLLNQLSKQIGLATPLTVDGIFGANTQMAVLLAQRKYGTPPGELPGQVTEVYYNGLEHQLQSPPPSGPPIIVPVDHGICAPVTGLKLTGEGPHSYKIEFTYAKQGKEPAASFEIATCAGSHLGKIVPTYPRSIKFEATGTYGGQYGGVNTKTGPYIVAVRALAANGKQASEWSTVKLPKLG